MNRVQKLYRLLKDEFPGESDEQIAKRLGMSGGAISGWRNGRSEDPRTNNIATVAKVTGRNAGELLAWLYGPDDQTVPKERLEYNTAAPPP